MYTLTPEALGCAIWQLRGDVQLVSWRYVVDFYELRSVGTAEAKLGPVVFTVTTGELRQSKRMDTHKHLYTHIHCDT